MFLSMRARHTESVFCDISSTVIYQGKFCIPDKEKLYLPQPC